MESELIELFLTKAPLKHFTITTYQELRDIKTKTMCYEIDLEGINNLPTVKSIIAS